jgi:predicted acetyltransferase
MRWPMTELAIPSKRYRASFLVASAEYAAEAVHLGAPDRGQVTAATFDAMLAKLADSAAGRNLPPDRVAESTYWLVDGDEYLGRISLRHSLSPELSIIGGHIGYVVRPSRRREGHATRMLALALPELAARGIDPALITCDEDNVASRKIIERARGQLATDISVPGKLRYWIPTR